MSNSRKKPNNNASGSIGQFGAALVAVGGLIIVIPVSIIMGVMLFGLHSAAVESGLSILQILTGGMLLFFIGVMIMFIVGIFEQ